MLYGKDVVKLQNPFNLWREGLSNIEIDVIALSSKPWGYCIDTESYIYRPNQNTYYCISDFALKQRLEYYKEKIKTWEY